LPYRRSIHCFYLGITSVLFFITAHANINQFNDPPKINTSDAFSSINEIHLHGEIINGRYHSPKNVFSCQADKFGNSQYISQDILEDDLACVAFYDTVSNYKKAEILLLPGLEERNLDRKDLKKIFDLFAINILKTVDNAIGLEVLSEELLENNLLFLAISIGKMSVLKNSNGKYPSATRGYVVFQDKDKVVLLSIQQITPYAQNHNPKKHIGSLKKGVLEFKKTFEFGPIPKSSIEKITKTQER